MAIDTEAIDELHDEFALPALLRRKEQTGVHEESGRPKYDTTEYDITARLERTNQPKEVTTDAGDSVLVDIRIRLKASELDALGVYPAPEDIITMDHSPHSKEFEIMRVLDRQTGVLECECVRNVENQ